MKRIEPRLLALLFAAMLFWGCREEYRQPDTSGTGKATVQLRLSANGYDVINTRTSDDDLKDVTVLQFKNGKLVYRHTIDAYAPATQILDNMVSMSQSALDANGEISNPGMANVVVCLANFKDHFETVYSTLTVDSDITTGTPYTDFIKNTVSLTDGAAIGALTHIPMVGYYYGALLAGETNTMSVTLKRAMAKINFTLDVSQFSNLGKYTTASVKAIELRNVPKEFVFFPQGYPGKIYPAATGNWSKAAPDEPSYTKLDVAQNLTDGNPLAGFVAYMPANAKGNHPAITGYSQKHPGSAGNAPGWTYVYVGLEYVDTTTGNLKKAEYQFYIGGNTTDDVNLLGGTQYNITARIIGAYSSDVRITVGDEETLPVADVLDVKDPANSYIVNDAFKTGNPAIPMQQAIGGWTFIESLLVNGTDNSTALATLLGDLNKWEVVTLWRTWPGSNIVMAAPTRDDSGNPVAYLYGLNDVPPGNNCVIALRDATSKEIWWTWHLWFTDYNPDVLANGQVHTYISDAFKTSGIYEHSVMMDRNLGATGLASDLVGDIVDPTTFTDGLKAGKWYGLMYQWGKKDPYTSTEGAGTGNGNATPIYDANGNKIEYTDWNIAGLTVSHVAESVDGFPKVKVDGINRLIDATRMPYVYFHTGLNNSWTNLHYHTLWGSNDAAVNNSKTTFDPCPPGWRVPIGGTIATNNPWAGFADSRGEQVANSGQHDIFRFWDNNGAAGGTAAGVRAGRYYDASLANPAFGTTKAWYPASGYRYSTSGGFNNVGSYGYFWSAAATGTYGYHLYFTSTNVNPRSEALQGVRVSCPLCPRIKGANAPCWRSHFPRGI